MTVKQNILDGKYDPGPLPTPPRRPIPVFSYGSDHVSSSEYRQHADALDAYERQMEEYRQAMARYTTEQGKLLAVFSQDLAMENGVLGHPRAGMLFDLSMRCAEGQSMHDVATWYVDLSQLIR